MARVIMYFVLVLTVVLFAASNLFADEFCNLELVDVWKCPVLSSASIWSSGLETKDDYLYFPGRDHVYVLNTSDSGHISLNSTVLNPVDPWIGDIKVRNNLAYVSHSTRVSIYDVSNPLVFDSLGTVIFNYANQLSLVDTLLLADANGIHVINISDSTNPTYIKRFTTPWSKTYLLTIDEDTYPYCLVPCENRVDEGPPEIWDAYINVIDLTESYDHSPYLNDWTPVYTDDTRGMKKIGDYYIGMCDHFLKFFEMDSVFGYTSVSSSYYVGYSVLYIDAINDSIIYLATKNKITLLSIADTADITVLGNYTNTNQPHEYFYDIVVQDSFFYAFAKIFGESASTDTLAVYSFKIDLNWGIQCGFNDSPKNMELKSYPNPFNSKCSIKYSMADRYKPVNLDIFNINGKAIQSYKGLPSQHSLSWNASNYPSGIYLVKASNGIESISQKIIYMR